MTARIAAVLVAGLAAVLAVTAVGTASSSRRLPPQLAAVKEATAQFRSVARAQEAGYHQASPCESSSAGGMGHHFVNAALAMDPAIDPLRPEVLLYAPKRNGRLRLVGVEYFAVALANTPGGPAPWFGEAPPPGGFFTPAPTLFGRVFDGPMPGHAAGMPWHYDLHAWVWKRNPTGIFALWNPRVRCP